MSGRAVIYTVVYSAISFSLAAGVAGATAYGNLGSRQQPVQAVTAARGVRLSVTVPRSVYPSSALVRVSIRLDNTSRHAVRLAVQCPGGYLEAQMVNRADEVKYPPLFRQGDGPALPCKVASPRRVVPPGRSLESKQYVVLRTRRLRAVVDLGPVGRPRLIETPPLVLTLTPGTPPRVSLITTPSLMARIAPATGGHWGSLLYQESILCPLTEPGGVAGGSVTTRWHRIFPKREYSFYPSCPAPLEWHVVAGWANQPVALIDYPDS